MKLIKLLIALLISVALFGCATETPLKAPCNWSGSNCYPKVKINQWDNTGN